MASFVVRVGAIAADLRRRIDLDTARSRRIGTIEKRRGVLGGKAVFAGTRISVEAVKNLLRDGATTEEIRELYPDLTDRDIDAARKADLRRLPRLAS